MPYIKSGKREVYIDPDFEDIVVGAHIAVDTGRHYYKAVVGQSLTRQINVTVTYPNGITEEQVYSKTDGHRIRCSEYHRSDKIAIRYHPSRRLMDWADVDEMKKQHEAKVEKRCQVKRLQDYSYDKFTAEQLTQVEELLASFE